GTPPSTAPLGPPEHRQTTPGLNRTPKGAPRVFTCKPVSAALVRRVSGGAFPSGVLSYGFLPTAPRRQTRLQQALLEEIQEKNPMKTSATSAVLVSIFALACSTHEAPRTVATGASCS